jgi:hypothetical protein
MQATSSGYTASGPPLDYSFKELRSCAEIETEEPRSGARRMPDTREGGGDGVDGESAGAEGEDAAGAVTATATGNAPGAGRGGATGGGLAATNATQVTALPSATAAGSQKKLFVIKKVTTAVKLNNNLLETAQGLPEALGLAMNNPTVTLQWLDLSFNKLVTIDAALLRFVNLKALYLHGNCIRSLPAVEKMRKLPKLLILTLNGNPIESSKIYRPYVIGSLPALKSLDHSTVTDDETQSAISWFKGHVRRKKERDERLRDMALAGDEM